MAARLGRLLVPALAVALATIAAIQSAGAPLTTFALFAAAVIVAQLFLDADRGRSREPVGAEPFRVASGVHLAAALVLGPWPAALLAALGTLSLRPFRGLPWRAVSIQALAFALAALGGGYGFELAGSSAGSVVLPQDLVALAVAGAAYAAVRAGLLDLLQAREPFRLDIPAAAAETGFAAVVAVCALGRPWNVLALIPLVLAVHAAQVRLRDVRKETLHALETLANIVDERDPSTYQHSLRVAGYVDSLARALRLPFSDVDRLRWAGRLHDLGKVAVDASVLRKRDALDGAEWAAMRRHPRLSARLLQRFEFAAPQARAVEYHHERFDGAGYYGLNGRDLPLASHFLIVADSFDAMMADRPYRPGLTREQALAEIERNVGTQFHPAVARAFVAVQRGIDPARALSPAELDELRGACATHRLPRVPGTADLKERPELVALGGLVAALVGVGLSLPFLAAAGGLVALAAFARPACARLRAGRLAARLQAAIAGGGDRGEVFQRVAACLETACGATWTALVSWREDGLGGAVDFHRGEHGVPDAALFGWLVREAESGADLIATPGFELGGDGVHVALPLRRDNSALVGFFVLAAPRALRRHVQLAVQASLDALGLALAERPSEPTDDPAREQADPLPAAV